MPITTCVAVPHPPLILPEVGRGGEELIQPTADAYRAAMERLAADAPETVVVVSPHATLYADWFHISPGKGAKGGFAHFGAPGVVLQAEYDTQLVAAIGAEAKKTGLPAGTAGERDAALDHGTAVPLYFLRQVYSGFKVVRIGLSGLGYDDHYRLGQCIAAAAGDKRVAVIASGDLSHKLKADGPYGFVPQGPRLDAAITGALGSGDFGALMDIDPSLADEGAECGLRSFIVMAGALDGRAVQAELLSYQDVTGVGYGVATFVPDGPDESRRFLLARQAATLRQAQARRQTEDPWVALARRTLESAILRDEKPTLSPSLPQEMTGQRAGVFVSLHKGGALRGCIGTTGPTTAGVAEEIVQNAVSAAVRDPRFPPVRPDEVDLLEINVDVLGEAQPIDSEDELDPKRYGVIVSQGARRGLLLPDLEGVDTVRQQVDIAKSKAGIGQSEPVQLERFAVVRHV